MDTEIAIDEVANEEAMYETPPCKGELEQCLPKSLINAKDKDSNQNLLLNMIDKLSGESIPQNDKLNEANQANECKIVKVNPLIDQNVEDEESESESEDDCIFLGATHFINLLSSDEENVIAPAPINVMNEIERKNYKLPALGTIVIGKIEVSDDDQETHETSEIKRKNEQPENKECQKNEDLVKKDQIVNNLVLDNEQDSNAELQLQLNQKNLTKALESNINEELETHINRIICTNLNTLQVKNLNNVNMSEIMNLAEILPELDFNLCLESNLKDVSSMEKEVNDVLKDIDEKAQETNENLEILNDIKLPIAENSTEVLENYDLKEKLENKLTSKVVWCANKGVNKANLKPTNTTNAVENLSNRETIQENVMGKVVWCQSVVTQSKLIQTPMGANMATSYGSSTSKTSSEKPADDSVPDENPNIPFLIENQCIADKNSQSELKKNIAATLPPANIESLTIVINTDVKVPNDSPTNKTMHDTQTKKDEAASTIDELDLSSDSSSSDSSDEDDDDDDDSGSESDSSSSSSSSSSGSSDDSSCSDESSKKQESEVESGEIRDDTDDENNTKPKEEPNPKKLKLDA